MLHKLMWAWTRLIGVLAHALIARISHGIHRLVLLDGCAVHRAAALSVMKLRRGMHRRLLRKWRLLRRPLSILLHVVLLRQW